MDGVYTRGMILFGWIMLPIFTILILGAIFFILKPYFKHQKSPHVLWISIIPAVASYFMAKYITGNPADIITPLAGVKEIIVTLPYAMPFGIYFTALFFAPLRTADKQIKVQ